MAQNRKDRRAEPTAPVKPAPEAIPVAELETLPITQEGWIGSPIALSDDHDHDRIDAETVRASGFVVECQLNALWPAFTPSLVEVIASEASVPHVDMGCERLYRVKDIDDALAAWFKSASYNRAVAAKQAKEA